MLVDAYGSDNSDDSGDEHTPPQPKKTTSLSLPPASHTSGSGSSSLTLPAPKVKKAPKKIAIDLPALPKDDSTNHDSDEAPPAKKARMETHGAGASALFSRLPAPKLAAPVKAAPERVLGGGKVPGLVFNNPPPQRVQDTFGTSSNIDAQSNLDVTEPSTYLPFMPVSVMKGKANVSLEESSSKGTKSVPDPSPSAMDLFSLSTSYYLVIRLPR
jgi:proline-rich protein PRCC